MAEPCFHDTTQASAPDDRGASVTVEYHCAACGLWIFTESWTKAAWEAEQAKQATRATPPSEEQPLQGATSPEPRG